MSDIAEKRFQLYGDESQFQGMVTYAFIIVPTILQHDIENEIAKIKQEFGLKLSDEVHCRKLFHKDAKEKTALRHLSKEEVFTLLQRLTFTIYLAGARAWVGYLNSSKASDLLYFESADSTKGEVVTWNISDIKLQMLFAYRAAIAPLTHFIPPDKVAAWVDGDTSKVPYLENFKQVNSLKSFFPVEHNNKKFFPTPVKNGKPVLLEIADILAYSAAHGLSSTYTKDKHHFESIVRNLNPGYSEVVFNTLAGGPYMSSRSFDPSDDIKTYVKGFI